MRKQNWSTFIQNLLWFTENALGALMRTSHTWIVAVVSCCSCQWSCRGSPLAFSPWWPRCPQASASSQCGCKDLKKKHGACIKHPEAKKKKKCLNWSANHQGWREPCCRGEEERRCRCLLLLPPRGLSHRWWEPWRFDWLSHWTPDIESRPEREPGINAGF